MRDSILVIDDEVCVTRSIHRALRQDKLDIYTANSAQQARQLLREKTIKVVISDQRMPNVTGTEFLAEVRDSYPDTVRMILSGYTETEALNRAINKGDIYKFLVKPWKRETLRTEVSSALHLHKQQQRNAQLHHLLQSAIEAIVLCDQKGQITSINPAYTKLTGHSVDHTLNQTIESLFLSKNRTPLTIDIVESDPNRHWHGECWCKQENDHYLPVWLNFMSIRKNNEHQYYALLFIDISEQKIKEAEIQHQAYHDDLTGLPNRRLLTNHLQFALRQTFPKQTNATLALLFINLDRFKTINDSLGHEVGDTLLRDTSKRLSSVLHQGDTLARFGGDEFVVLLSDVKSNDYCRSLCERIMQVLKPAFYYRDQEIFVSASIGISTTKENTQHADTLLRHADTAMHKAKQRGGNAFTFFDQREDEKLRERMIIEAGLRRGVERDEFVVFYQAQMDVASGELRGCEALVRWQHPVKDLVYPGSFIEIAEQVGLIQSIGGQVIDKACRCLSEWRHQFGFELQLSINLSAYQFDDKNLPNTIDKWLAKYQINPTWLELEITETALLHYLERSVSTLNTLSDKGISIALDDFGTGYSSLSYLQRLPINTLKIDQSFIKPLPKDQKTMAIVVSIIHMAKSLGLTVVAEGVETKEQYEFLRGCECDIVQGYFICPPLNESDFLKFLLSHKKSRTLAEHRLRKPHKSTSFFKRI